MGAHYKPQYKESDGVMVVALLGSTKILLIQEVSKPTPHYWKLISETIEKGEPPLNTLWGGLREEAGFVTEARRVEGIVAEITDRRVLRVMELLPPHMLEKPRPHMRYFFGVLTTDEVIMSLSDQQLTGDENEEIFTKAFDLARLDTLPDLMPKHRDLIMKISNKKAA